MLDDPAQYKAAAKIYLASIAESLAAERDFRMANLVNEEGQGESTYPDYNLQQREAVALRAVASDLRS